MTDANVVRFLMRPADPSMLRDPTGPRTSLAEQRPSDVAFRLARRRFLGGIDCPAMTCAAGFPGEEA